MHNHDNKNNDGMRSMMWMMLPCLLLVVVLLLASGKLTSSGLLWPILIGGFVVLHVWMMFKGHGGHGKSDEVDALNQSATTPEKQNANSEHKHGGSCH